MWMLLFKHDGQKGTGIPSYLMSSQVTSRKSIRGILPTTFQEKDVKMQLVYNSNTQWHLLNFPPG